MEGVTKKTTTVQIFIYLSRLKMYQPVPIQCTNPYFYRKRTDME